MTSPPSAASGARPPRLVLRFAIYSALALALAGAGILYVVRGQMLDQAERETAERAERVAMRVGERLDLRDFEGPVSPRRRAALDAAFAHELGDDLVLVKLWSPDGVVAYSNDHELIGARTAEAEELRATLEGEVQREVTDLAREGGAEPLRSLETFVPVHRGKRVVAGLETFYDYERIAADVRTTMTRVSVALVLTLLLLYAILLPILRQVTRALGARNSRLAEHAAELAQALEQRREAERRLDQAERNYRSLVEQLPLATYIDRLDETSSTIYMSPQIEEVMGYPALAWMGDPDFFVKVLHPDDRERVLEEHRRNYAAGQSFVTEYRCVARDGRTVWIHDEVMIARDDSGQAVHAQGFMLDISERKEAEQRLERSHAELTALHDTALQLIDELDAQKLLERIAAQAGELVGTDSTYVYLKDGDDELQVAVGTGAFDGNVGDRLAKGEGVAGRVWASGEPLTVDDYHTWDGRHPGFAGVPFHAVVGVPLRSRREVVGVLGAARLDEDRAFAQPEIDLLSRFAHLTSLALESARLYSAAQEELQERRRAEGALRDAELRYRTLVEHLPLATYISPVDSSLGNLYVSPQVEDLLGYPAEEWVRDPELLLRSVHPEDLERLLADAERLRATGEPVRAEYRYRAADGRTVWVLDETNLVRDEDGTPVWVQGFLLDISERKRAEAERDRLLADLAAQNERLRELDGLKDEFIALVSHELRTPLTSIQGYTELLLDGEAGELSGDQRQFLGVVERNAHRLLHLVGDLLFLAQVEAGKLVLDVDALDVGAVASETVETARPQAEAKGITLTLATGPVPLVAGDRARIAQLLDNLVSNAIKFTPAGGRVDVRVRMRQRRAVVEVRDSGIGIPAAEQQYLFERFYRTSTATEQAIQGTGLGLAISKAIVDAHDGRITLTSEEDVGTTFRVELPLGQHVELSAPTEVAS